MTCPYRSSACPTWGARHAPWKKPLHTLVDVAEGQRREGGNQLRAYEIASGEANEVLGCLDLAAAWGWPQDDHTARFTLGRLLRLLDGLASAPQAS